MLKFEKNNNNHHNEDMLYLDFVYNEFKNHSFHFQELTLTPNSRAYDNWKAPSIPLSLDIYLFNWTNPEDFTNHSIKPSFEQLGPFRFTEKPDKVDITWNDNNTVTYRKKSLFHFDEAGSQGSLDDMVTTVNMVALVSQSYSANCVRIAKPDRIE
jgi:CD36 family